MMRAHPGAVALATLIGCFAGPDLVAAATPPQSLHQQLLDGRAVDNRDFAAFAA